MAGKADTGKLTLVGGDTPSAEPQPATSKATPTRRTRGGAQGRMALKQERIARAASEPSLYPEKLATLPEAGRAKLARLKTPFAHELQLWIWEQGTPELHVSDVARKMRLPEPTVRAWFNRGTLPDRESYDAILETTGWPEAHLLALLGLDTRPAPAPSYWKLAHDLAEDYRYFGGEPRNLERVRALLDEAQRLYLEPAQRR